MGLFTTMISNCVGDMIKGHHYKAFLESVDVIQPQDTAQRLLTDGRCSYYFSENRILFERMEKVWKRDYQWDKKCTPCIFTSSQATKCHDTPVKTPQEAFVYWFLMEREDPFAVWGYFLKKE